MNYHLALAALGMAESHGTMRRQHDFFKGHAINRKRNRKLSRIGRRKNR